MNISEWTDFSGAGKDLKTQSIYLTVAGVDVRIDLDVSKVQQTVPVSITVGSGKYQCVRVPPSAGHCAGGLQIDPLG